MPARLFILTVLVVLLVVTMLQVPGAITSSAFLLQLESALNVRQGNLQLAESTPEPCLFIEIKGPHGIRAITCGTAADNGSASND